SACSGSQWTDWFQMRMVWVRQGHSSLPHPRSLALPIVVLRKRLRLAIDKVIHHDDVILPVIVRTWGNVACRNPHPRNPSIAIDDAKERQTPIASRGRDKAAK